MGLAIPEQWKEEEGGSRIRREFEFAGFAEAIAFVNATAEIAEEMDHHPDIDVRYDRVSVTLSTHSENAVTTKDIAQAERLNALI